MGGSQLRRDPRRLPWRGMPPFLGDAIVRSTIQVGPRSQGHVARSAVRHSRPLLSMPQQGTSTAGRAGRAAQ
jgi:hypothetical protein